MWNFGYRCCGIIYALISDICDQLFLLYWLCWCIIRFSRHSGYPLGFLNNWLTDFVFVPVVVHTALVLGNYLFSTGKPLKYTLGQILFFSLYTSVVFELMMPVLTTYNTGDWGDVLMYFMGGFFYHYVHQEMYLKKNNIRLNGLKNRVL